MYVVIQLISESSFLLSLFYSGRGQSGGIQIQQEDEVSVELIQERERAIRQLEVCTHSITPLIDHSMNRIE